jgi:hypothetical protein
MEYESVTQRVLFGNAVLAILMSVREYDVILQNGDCSRENNVRTLFRNKVRYQVVTEFNMYKVTIPVNLGKAVESYLTNNCE